MHNTRVKKRVLHHPTLFKRYGKVELWEGCGPERQNWGVKIPGGWRIARTKVQALRFVQESRT